MSTMLSKNEEVVKNTIAEHMTIVLQKANEISQDLYNFKEKSKEILFKNYTLVQLMRSWISLKVIKENAVEKNLNAYNDLKLELKEVAAVIAEVRKLSDPKDKSNSTELNKKHTCKKLQALTNSLFCKSVHVRWTFALLKTELAKEKKKREFVTSWLIEHVEKETLVPPTSVLRDEHGSTKQTSSLTDAIFEINKMIEKPSFPFSDEVSISKHQNSDKKQQPILKPSPPISSKDGHFVTYQRGSINLDSLYVPGPTKTFEPLGSFKFVLPLHFNMESNPHIGATPTISGTTSVKCRPLIEAIRVDIDGFPEYMAQFYGCITMLKEYEHKSLEELRLEDYFIFGVFGQQNITFVQGNRFTRDFKKLNVIHVKFQPTHDIEITCKENENADQFQSITLMKEYENQSFEELRLSDYIIARVFIPEVFSANGMGTARVMFFPPTENEHYLISGGFEDTIVSYHCITALKEFKKKSLEELRLEDYIAGRRGPTQSVFKFQQNNYNLQKSASESSTNKTQSPGNSKNTSESDDDGDDESSEAKQYDQAQTQRTDTPKQDNRLSFKYCWETLIPTLKLSDSWRNAAVDVERLLEDGENEEAIKKSSDALELNSENIFFLVYRACAYYELKQYREALDDAQKVDSLFPNLPAIGYRNIAKCCLALGDIAQGEQAIRRALERDPSFEVTEVRDAFVSLRTEQERVQSCMSQQNYYDAVHIINDCLKFYCPASARMKILKAECLAHMRKYEEARSIAIDLSSLSVNAQSRDAVHADAMYVTGLCSYYQENDELATKHFRKVLELDPDHEKAIKMFKLTKTRMETKLIKQKKEQESSTNKTQSPENSKNTSESDDDDDESSEAKQYDQAQTQRTDTPKQDNRLFFLNCWQSLRPTLSDSWRNAAADVERLLEDGENEEAIKKSSDALELNPENIFFLVYRASAYYELKQYREALDDVQKVDSLFPNLPAIGYYNIAICCLALGDIAQGEQAIRRALERDPSYEETKVRDAFVSLRTEQERVQSFMSQQNYYDAVHIINDCLKFYCPASARMKILKAECLAHMRKYEEARSIAIDLSSLSVNAQSRDAVHADAMYVTGLCSYYQENDELATKHFRKVLELDPDHEKAIKMFKLTKTRMETKLIKQKKEQESSTNKTQSPENSKNTSESDDDDDESSEAKQYDQAQTQRTDAPKQDNRLFFLNCWQSLRPTLSDSWRNAAADVERLLEDGENEEAIKKSSDALELNPENIFFLVYRASAYYELKQYREALDDVQKVDSLFPNLPAIGYYNIAICCLALGDIAQGEQAIRRALERDPSYEETKVRDAFVSLRTEQERVQSCMSQQNYYDAVHIINDCLKFYCPASARMKILKAECLAHMRKYEEARSIAIDLSSLSVNAQSRDAVHADAMYVTGLCSYYQENDELATKHFRKVLELDPDHEKAIKMFKLTKTRMETKLIKQKKEQESSTNKTQSPENSKNTSESDDDDDESSEAKQYDQAQTQRTDTPKQDNRLFFLNCWQSLRPTLSDSWRNAAADVERLLEDGENEEAIKKSSDALELNPENIFFLVYRASAYYELKQYREALDDVQKVDSLFPNLPAIGYYNIAICCLALGDIAQGEQAIRRALERDPSYEETKVRDAFVSLRTEQERVQSCMSQQNYYDAVHIINDCLKFYCPASARMKILKAECLAHMRKYEEARSIAIDLSSLSVNAQSRDAVHADAMYVTGLCSYYQENDELATKHFRKVLELDPDHEKAIKMFKLTKTRMETKLIKQKKEQESSSSQSQSPGNSKNTSENRQEQTEKTDTPNQDNETFKYWEILPTQKLRVSAEHEANARKLLKDGEFEEAFSISNDALKLDPENVFYLMYRACANCDLEQYRESINDAQKANSHLAQGEQALRRVLELRKVLTDGQKELCDEFASFRTEQERVQSCMSQQNYHDAVHIINDCLNLYCPASSMMKIMKAECLAHLRKYEEARSIANDLSISCAGDKSTDAVYADVIYVIGLCSYYQENDELATKQFRKVLELDPDHEKAIKMFKLTKTRMNTKLIQQKKELGNKAFKEGEWTKALKFYDEALSIDKNNKEENAKLHYNRATVFAKQNQLRNSIDACTAALELDGNYIKALLKRAQCYNDIEMYEESLDDYEKLYYIDSTKENKRLFDEANSALNVNMGPYYYYKVLEINKYATQAEIKKAYKKCALRYHPDRHSGSSLPEVLKYNRKFKLLKEAYDTLVDPTSRAAYDINQSE